MGKNFDYSEIFKSSFETKCMKLLIEAYRTSIAEKEYHLDWNEDDFTDLLDHYITNNPARAHDIISNKRECYLYDDTTPKQKGFADSEKRIDLECSTFSSDKEYHQYFEAKRLKESDSYLYKRYIETGIDSFVSGKYPKGILIAYLVDGNMDNVVKNGINKLLINNNRKVEILSKVKIQIYDQYYESVHPHFGVLKHLMFDFTV
jgi:hypothetical protein